VSDATKDLNQAVNSLIGSEASEKLEALKGVANFGSQNGVDDLCRGTAKGYQLGTGSK
jgi:hypothetical protein